MISNETSLEDAIDISKIWNYHSLTHSLTGVGDGITFKKNSPSSLVWGKPHSWEWDCRHRPPKFTLLNIHLLSNLFKQNSWTVAYFTFGHFLISACSPQLVCCWDSQNLLRKLLAWTSFICRYIFLRNLQNKYIPKSLSRLQKSDLVVPNTESSQSACLGLAPKPETFIKTTLEIVFIDIVPRGTALRRLLNFVTQSSKSMCFFLIQKRQRGAGMGQQGRVFW